MFFSFDGLDGVGKTTQMNLFLAWLGELGHEVVSCYDPGSTPLGEAVRAILLGHQVPIARTSEMLLFMAARHLASRMTLPDLPGWKSLSVRAVTVGALLGAWSHVLLDSIMHADIRPLAPFSDGNSFLHFVSVDMLHGTCLVLGVLGMLVVLLRFIRRGNT